MYSIPKVWSKLFETINFDVIGSFLGSFFDAQFIRKKSSLFFEKFKIDIGGLLE
jgi:hypothetical protein